MRKTFDNIIGNYVVKKKLRYVELAILIVSFLAIVATVIFVKESQTRAGYFNLFQAMFVLMGSILMFGCCIGLYHKGDSNFAWFSTLLVLIAVRALIFSFILCTPDEQITKPLVANIISVVSILVTLVTFIFLVGYIRSIANPEKSTGNSFLLAMCFAVVIIGAFYIYSAFSGKIFVRGDFAWLFSFIPGTCVIYLIIPIVSGLFAISYLMNATDQYVKKRNKVYITYIVVYLVAMIVQTPFPYCITSLADYFLVCLLYNDEAVKKSIALAESEREITTQRMDIMRSQIQPHFIFNALNTICYLCRKDPQTAETATKNFAAYLRMNIDSIGNATEVAFSKELQHVKTYLELESLRFGDKISVEYEIEFMEFNIPPLTLQPIVENAVKHGFGKTKTALNIRISCKKDNDHIVIKIIDDGVGFNMEKVDWGTGNHIGVMNVKERIQNIAKGKFEVYSLEGTGTMATIKLPLHSAEGGNN